ncbi:MAG: carbamoyltransferase [Alphaproteobacteria bacterium]
MKKIRIIGISAYFHDSSVALIEDGNIVYASQEERFSRKKHDSSFPKNALKNLLEFNKIKLSDVNHIIFFEKPFLKFERLLETYLAFAPKGIKQFLFSIPIWIKKKLFMKNEILKELKNFDKKFESKKIFFSEHHLSHAASAFFPSPFLDALILTADGVGEWATTTVALGQKNKIEIKKEINFPNSLGLLYSAFTYFIGFKVNSGEYKLMGLAPYGKPIYADLIKEKMVHIKEDGSFRLNQDYFDYSTGFKMVNDKFCHLFKQKPRSPETKITKFHMDIASSIQKVTEEIMIKILNSLQKEYKTKNLCLAGGVALNCVANGIIKQKKIFKNIWIQPAAGDAGGSLGAALALWYMHLNKKRVVKKEDNMTGSFLGPRYETEKIVKILNDLKAYYVRVPKKKLCKLIAKKISKGNAVGWFQGRMEFGPRALGGRSILADPRNKNMQKQLNLKIKFRESFRPFAPSVLKKYSENWFNMKGTSPYMLFVSKLKANKLIKKNNKIKSLSSINNLRSVVPGITHVDYSARVQTIDNKANKMFYQLIEEFYKITKTPMLINTSFNIRGEPIVCSPEDAYRCFMGTNLDVLVLEELVLEKKKQDKRNLKDYKNKFDLD